MTLIHTTKNQIVNLDLAQSITYRITDPTGDEPRCHTLTILYAQGSTTLFGAQAKRSWQMIKAIAYRRENNQPKGQAR